MKKNITIKFKLIIDQLINLSIYDIKGTKIKDLMNGIYHNGNYKIIWNGKDNSGKYVNKGLYFYKLETEKGVKFVEPLVY